MLHCYLLCSNCISCLSLYCMNTLTKHLLIWTNNGSCSWVILGSLIVWNNYPMISQRQSSHRMLKITSGRYKDIWCNFEKVGVLIIVVCWMLVWNKNISFHFKFNFLYWICRVDMQYFLVCIILFRFKWNAYFLKEAPWQTFYNDILYTVT